MKALDRGELSLVLVAEDATENALARMSGLFREEAPPVRRFATRRELGEALGRGPLVAVGISDDSLAGAVVSALEESSSGASAGTGADGRQGVSDTNQAQGR